jgi:hypothetical protein
VLVKTKGKVAMLNFEAVLHWFRSQDLSLSYSRLGFVPFSAMLNMASGSSLININMMGFVVLGGSF